MENIIEPDDTFDFTKLSLAHPVGIQGGAFFTKIEYNSKPLYIQTCKSQSRQGIVKTGKKYYCDLMFDNNASLLINWFENLEERCKKMIFDRRDTWFQNNLEESDIDIAFNSTIRVYKSGKYYLVRTNIKTHNSNPFVKIYDEHEIPLKVDDINDKTNIISILEIQGIKFTARNFQIDIDLKQVMVLDDEPLFDNCLIKTINNKSPVSSNTLIAKEKPLEKDSIMNKLEELSDAPNIENINNEKTKQEIMSTTQITNNLEETAIELSLEETASDQIITTNEIPKESNNISFDLEFENLDENIEENTYDLKEINNLNLDLENSLETIHLKKPNQVYFELYKEARNKAKNAKKMLF